MRWFEAPGAAALISEIAARERRLGLREAADHRAVAWTWQSIRSTNQRSTLASIEIPTLIVHGSHDTDSPVARAHWIVEGAGHSLPIENTNVAAAVVRRFLTC